jgi:hypothetical protein
MLLQKKALYNLLQLNLPRIESGELKIGDLQSWQIDNYREKTVEELFQQLKGLGIILGNDQFQAYGKHFEAPEEMVEELAKEREPLEKDHIYLILFEMWRRSFPEKRTISIFCDELDNQMMAFDLGRPNQVADALDCLQQLLDEHVDQGLDPKQAFQLIQMYCANDIASFLFDYTLALIEEGNYSYATEMLDGCKRYMEGSPWFIYLEARALILEDAEEGYCKLERFIEQVHTDTNLELLEEILFFLANSGNHSLFYTLAKKMLPMLKKEEDFKVFIEACYVHYDYLELKVPALAIAKLYHGRKEIDTEQLISQIDPGMMQIRAILNQKIHFSEE